MIQTCSLETSKLIKENGFKQNSSFDWVQFSSRFEPKVCFSEYGIRYIMNNKICSAPVTDELLEELPEYINSLWLTIRKLHDNYSVGYMFDEGWLYLSENKSLPEALAQMWLHLKQQGLLESKE